MEQGEPSRWWRSKTWRSPSSPQIHQKYIYMWNNSYRTPTERWQKTSDFPKATNSPCTWVGQKKKGKTETKEYRRDLHLWEGAVKEEKFPHTRKPHHWWKRGWGWGIFRAMEESAATGVQSAKRRASSTEDKCRPALNSLRDLSARLPGQVGAGSWGSGFVGQIPGRELRLAAWTQPEGG